MRSILGRLGNSRIRTVRAAVLICGAAALVVSALFLGPASGASDKNNEPPLDEAELERAQLLFRHYCMDCHGPRLTGDDHDFTLLCPNVQGKDVDDYRETVREGDGDMPAFFVCDESPCECTSGGLEPCTNGHLEISIEDFILLTLHEATFPENEKEDKGPDFPEEEEDKGPDFPEDEDEDDDSDEDSDD